MEGMTEMEDLRAALALSGSHVLAHLPIHRGFKAVLDRERAALGSPESIAEQIKTKVFDAGIDGIIFNMPNYTPGAVAAVAEALKPLLPH